MATKVTLLTGKYGDQKWMLDMHSASGEYQVRAQLVEDAGNWRASPWVDLSDAAHTFEIAWAAASADGADDGSLTWWMDGEVAGSLTGIDNDQQRIDYFELGVFDIPDGTRGTVYFDDIASQPDANATTGQIRYDRPAARMILASYHPAQKASMLPSVSQVSLSLPVLPGLYVAPLLRVTHSHLDNPLLALTIGYTYDPLGRLTGASYSDGSSYTYTYDAVGNRLSEETSAGTVDYTYDEANRLTSVGEVAYSWDDNGNLLNDGASAYTYDAANRLTSVTQGENTYTYSYRCNGKSSGQFAVDCESDRVSQTINGVTTHFVVDSSSSLSQVLSDGTNNYLYGDGLIAQDPGAGPEYFLTDGLGSVRQLADTSSQIILNRTYQPYGQELTTQGRESTLFGFTGEITDPSGLVYLRSRYYDPGNGRFLTQDTWPGRQTDPASYNAWLYANSNPINYADPSGKCYGPLSFLRKLPIEGEICEHLDQAMFIYLWPGSSSAQKWGASAYIGGWAFAHSGIIVGTGGLAVAGGQAAITWLTELYAASKFAQQLNQACQQLQTYLPSLQPPANVNNLWNQVMVATPKIGYLLNSPGKDGFIKLGYTAETLQAELLTIGETVTPDLLSRVTEYGPRFEKVVEVVGPSGLMGRITTVWQVDNGTTILRFITAIPEVFK